MPYKDKEKQKEAVKKAVDKHRGITNGITEQGITPKGITEYPPLLYALADVKKRAKLRAICQSLSEHHVLQEVRYGVYGTTMDVVAEYLTALK